MKRFGPGEIRRLRWQAEERRRQPRLKLELPVKLCGAISGVLHDVSRTGLCVITDDALEEQQTVAFDLVDDATGQSCPFQARVIWYRPGIPARAGLEFIPLTPDQDAWLASRFVDWLTGGLARQWGLLGLETPEGAE